MKLRSPVSAPLWFRDWVSTTLQSALDRLERADIGKRPVLVAEFDDETDLPSAADYRGGVIWVNDTNTSVNILCFSDGSNWKRSDTGATV